MSEAKEFGPGPGYKGYFSDVKSTPIFAIFTEEGNIMEPRFYVNSWTATFDQRRGPTRCLEVWLNHPEENQKPDLLLYVSKAGRVRVFKRQKDGSVKRLR